MSESTWDLWRSRSSNAVEIAEMLRGHSTEYLREMARDARELAVIVDMVLAEDDAGSAGRATNGAVSGNGTCEG